jgi:hypothetical protein
MRVRRLVETNNQTPRDLDEMLHMMPGTEIGPKSPSPKRVI